MNIFIQYHFLTIQLRGTLLITDAWFNIFLFNISYVLIEIKWTPNIKAATKMLVSDIDTCCQYANNLSYMSLSASKQTLRIFY